MFKRRLVLAVVGLTLAGGVVCADEGLTPLQSLASNACQGMIDNIYSVMPYAMNLLLVALGIAVVVALIMMAVRAVRG